MVTYPEASVRGVLYKFRRVIDDHFGALDKFLQPKSSSSTDSSSSTNSPSPSNTANHNWDLEWKEFKRMSIRFHSWAEIYPPGTAAAEYDEKQMMDKKKELLTLYNKVYDATTNLLLHTEDPTWSSTSRWPVQNLLSRGWRDDASSSSEDDTKSNGLPLRATQPEERTEEGIKRQCTQLLFKFVFQVYEYKTFKFESKNFGPEFHPEYRRTYEHNQEQKDPKREVYKVLYESEEEDQNLNEEERDQKRGELTFKLFETIRHKDIAAPPIKG